MFWCSCTSIFGYTRVEDLAWGLKWHQNFFGFDQFGQRVVGSIFIFPHLGAKYVRACSHIVLTIWQPAKANVSNMQVVFEFSVVSVEQTYSGAAALHIATCYKNRSLTVIRRLPSVLAIPYNPLSNN